MITKIVIVDGNEWTHGAKYFITFFAKKVQIWHGNGIKKIGLLNPNITTNGRRTLRSALYGRFPNYDLLVLPSKYQVEDRASAFRYKRVVLNGQPRNDQFFSTNNESIKVYGTDSNTITIVEDFMSSGYKVITYAPTHRDKQLQEYEKTIKTFVHVVNELTKEKKFLLVIKHHAKEVFYLDISPYYHVVEYDKSKEVYPVLEYCESLITDYSYI